MVESVPARTIARCDGCNRENGIDETRGWARFKADLSLDVLLGERDDKPITAAWVDLCPECTSTMRAAIESNLRRGLARRRS